MVNCSYTFGYASEFEDEDSHDEDNHDNSDNSLSKTTDVENSTNRLGQFTQHITCEKSNERNVFSEMNNLTKEFLKRKDHTKACQCSEDCRFEIKTVSEKSLKIIPFTNKEELVLDLSNHSWSKPVYKPEPFIKDARVQVSNYYKPKLLLSTFKSNIYEVNSVISLLDPRKKLKQNISDKTEINQLNDVDKINHCNHFGNDECTAKSNISVANPAISAHMMTLSENTKSSKHRSKKFIPRKDIFSLSAQKYSDCTSANACIQIKNPETKFSSSTLKRITSCGPASIVENISIPVTQKKKTTKNSLDKTSISKNKVNTLSSKSQKEIVTASKSEESNNHSKAMKSTVEKISQVKLSAPNHAKGPFPEILCSGDLKLKLTNVNNMEHKSFFEENGKSRLPILDSLKVNILDENPVKFQSPIISTTIKDQLKHKVIDVQEVKTSFVVEKTKTLFKEKSKARPLENTKIKQSKNKAKCLSDVGLVTYNEHNEHIRNWCTDSIKNAAKSNLQDGAIASTAIEKKNKAKLTVDSKSIVKVKANTPAKAATKDSIPGHTILELPINNEIIVKDCAQVDHKDKVTYKDGVKIKPTDKNCVKSRNEPLDDLKSKRAFVVDIAKKDQSEDVVQPNLLGNEKTCVLQCEKPNSPIMNAAFIDTDTENTKYINTLTLEDISDYSSETENVNSSLKLEEIHGNYSISEKDILSTPTTFDATFIISEKNLSINNILHTENDSQDIISMPQEKNLETSSSSSINELCNSYSITDRILDDSFTQANDKKCIKEIKLELQKCSACFLKHLQNGGDKVETNDKNCVQCQNSTHFFCPKCGLKCINLLDLHAHLLNNYNKKKSLQFQCSSCQMISYSKYHYFEHIAFSNCSKICIYCESLFKSHKKKLNHTCKNIYFLKLFKEDSDLKEKIRYCRNCSIVITCANQSSVEMCDLCLTSTLKASKIITQHHDIINSCGLQTSNNASSHTTFVTDELTAWFTPEKEVIVDDRKQINENCERNTEDLSRCETKSQVTPMHDLLTISTTVEKTAVSKLSVTASECSPKEVSETALGFTEISIKDGSISEVNYSIFPLNSPNQLSCDHLTDSVDYEAVTACNNNKLNVKSQPKVNCTETLCEQINKDKTNITKELVGSIPDRDKLFTEQKVCSDNHMSSKTVIEHTKIQKIANFRTRQTSGIECKNCSFKAYSYFDLDDHLASHHCFRRKYFCREYPCNESFVLEKCLDIHRYRCRQSISDTSRPYFDRGYCPCDKDQYFHDSQLKTRMNPQKRTMPNYEDVMNCAVPHKISRKFYSPLQKGITNYL